MSWLCGTLDAVERVARGARGSRIELCANTTTALEAADHLVTLLSSEAVLARIEADRAILAEHPAEQLYRTRQVDHPPWRWEQVLVSGEFFCPTCSDADEGPEPWPCRTVRLLASGWRTMPGWQEPWAPEGDAVGGSQR